MIIATAGHVDHGKTLLVKALTGIDADRLPEEKKRGMTIDLGFAYLPMGGAETAGFIDVPGHERFVHNMLAGVAGIDFVLFVLAADDGPMPQTREHLAILDLLNVQRGAIALTKIDRAAPSRVSEVRDQATALLAGTTLEGIPVFPVSAVTGEGIAALKEHLGEEARACPTHPECGNFRLAIDRCFRLSGAGLIVTGTVFSGAVAVGDQVRILHAGTNVRVRSIHAQNASSERGRAGQRCALNLSGAGLKQEMISRGDWVVMGDVPQPVTKMDARIRVLRDEPKPLVHWTPVHVHLGAAGGTGRVAILEGSRIAPGADGLVQLALDRPMAAVFGDGLILRDQSAQRTIGGGTVVDVFPPARGRAKPQRLAYVRAMQQSDHQRALVSLLDASPGGLLLRQFSANRNLTATEADRLIAGASVRTVQQRAFSVRRWNHLKECALATLKALHDAEPSAIAFPEDRLLDVPGEVAFAVCGDLLRDRTLAKEPSGVRLASHVAKLEGADAALWRKMVPLLSANALRPPTVNEMISALGETPKAVESFLLRAARHGFVVRVTANRYFLPDAVRHLATIAIDLAGQTPGRSVTAAALRDATGMGRTVAIEVLEYFDHLNFTRRVGDTHLVIGRTADMMKPVARGRETHPGGALGLQIR